MRTLNVRVLTMLRKLLNKISVPRWVILMIDLSINCCSFVLSYFLFVGFQFTEILRGHFFLHTGLYCLVSLTVFFFMRIHTGLIRYSNIHDMFRIFTAVLVTSIIFPILNEGILIRLYNIHSLPIGKVLLINFFIASSVLIMLRTGVKGAFYYVRRISSNNKERVLILGSDNNAILIKQALQSSVRSPYVVIGFIENNGTKANTSIQQFKVYHIKDLARLRNKQNVNTLVFANEQLASKDKQLLIDKCLSLGIKMLTVPPSDEWISGKLNIKQIQELKIEDLLQREPIVINNTKIEGELFGKRILITGAAGSIGSEIVRQVLKYQPEMVVLCDQAESSLHEIQLDVEEKYKDANIKTFICSVQNMTRMHILFKEYRPEIIFHAAAYKHVPMMENHPSEAIMTNVMGTKNVVDLAVLYQAEKFVMISTDKAVNPTNIMGASKRIAEMYVQSMNDAQDNISVVDVKEKSYIRKDARNIKTKFITTRFGNVLDSNGSVIPRFRAQIQKGGPVTVTDPNITRYFMTIPEAVQLVLEAGTMGKGGEIFIFDMGKPVRITDLALNMIKLAGLTPDRDIKIVYTGLRPGEKLYEELLNKEEETIPTHHEKIKIAKIIPHSHYKIIHDIQELINLCDREDYSMLVKRMKVMVPEFVSNNSVYEKLDLSRPDEISSVSLAESHN